MLIACDANTWFESGRVKDVTIKNNTFVDCGEPFIKIYSEHEVAPKERYMHKNINIYGNVFKIEKEKVLSIKYTKGIKF